MELEYTVENGLDAGLFESELKHENAENVKDVRN